MQKCSHFCCTVFSRYALKVENQYPSSSLIFSTQDKKSKLSACPFSLAFICWNIFLNPALVFVWTPKIKGLRIRWSWLILGGGCISATLEARKLKFGVRFLLDQTSLTLYSFKLSIPRFMFYYFFFKMETLENTKTKITPLPWKGRWLSFNTSKPLRTVTWVLKKLGPGSRSRSLELKIKGPPY